MKAGTYEWIAHPHAELGGRSGSAYILDMLDEKWMALLGALPGGGAAGRRGSGWVAGSWGRGPSRRQEAGGRACPAARCILLCANFAFALGQVGGGGAVPRDCSWIPGELIRKRLKPSLVEFHVSPRSWCRERQREKESKRPESWESPAAPRSNYKNVAPWVGLLNTVLTCCIQPSTSSCWLGVRAAPTQHEPTARWVPGRPRLGAPVGKGSSPGTGGRNSGLLRETEDNQQFRVQRERVGKDLSVVTVRRAGHCLLILKQPCELNTIVPTSRVRNWGPTGWFLAQHPSATLRGQIPAYFKVRLCHPTLFKTLGGEPGESLHHLASVSQLVKWQFFRNELWVQHPCLSYWGSSEPVGF